MREAWHRNDEKIYVIPQNLSSTEITNHKTIARKGTFSCPYCEAKLIVKSGDIHGNYFSHLHGEGCEMSKQSEKRYTRYEKQKKQDTPRHPQILSLMNDELRVLSRVYPNLITSYGYLDVNLDRYIPDISLKISEHKYAITIITNINQASDAAIVKSINKQKKYYESIGYEPLFFVERNHLGVDTDGQSLVLWLSEYAALTVQQATVSWQDHLNNLASTTDYQQILNISSTVLNVKSIHYITPANEEIAIEAFHVLEQPNSRPHKAYFLSDPYKLKISEAFKLDKDSLLLANLSIESENQTKFEERFNEMKRNWVAQQIEAERIENEHKAIAEREEMDRRTRAKEQLNDYRKKAGNSPYANADKEAKLALLKRAYGANNWES